MRLTSTGPRTFPRRLTDVRGIFLLLSFEAAGPRSTDAIGGLELSAQVGHQYLLNRCRPQLRSPGGPWQALRGKRCGADDGLSQAFTQWRLNASFNFFAASAAISLGGRPVCASRSRSAWESSSCRSSSDRTFLSTNLSRNLCIAIQIAFASRSLLFLRFDRLTIPKL